MSYRVAWFTQSILLKLDSQISWAMMLSKRNKKIQVLPYSLSSFFDMSLKIEVVGKKSLDLKIEVASFSSFSSSSPFSCCLMLSGDLIIRELFYLPLKLHGNGEKEVESWLAILETTLLT